MKAGQEEMGTTDQPMRLKSQCAQLPAPPLLALKNTGRGREGTHEHAPKVTEAGRS